MAWRRDQINIQDVLFPLDIHRHSVAPSPIGIYPPYTVDRRSNIDIDTAPDPVDEQDSSASPYLSSVCSV